jgi:hypothetical protein
MRHPLVLAAALMVFVACRRETTAPDRPVEWTDNAFTQPVPAWGSPVRLSLPVPLSSIRLDATGGFGAFGAHMGGHVEGLNHVWIPTGGPTTVRSWANGTVTKIEDTGIHEGAREYFVTVDYGQGLVGKHLDMTAPAVRVGDAVQEGGVIGVGRTAEFMLIDNRRSDGERTGGSIGSLVSPFDYLKDEVKAALLARYMAEVVQPYFMNGLSIGNQRPWEPFLTNKMLFHADHRGTIAGEWILTNKGWSAPDPLYFEVLVVFDVTNSYGHFLRYEAMDHDWSAAGNKNHVSGAWQAGDGAGKVLFIQDLGPTYCGLFAVDETGPRAKLTIEWRLSDCPTSLSSNAAVYLERGPIYLHGDAQQLGLLK